MPDRPTIPSVVVVTCFGGPWLARCIASLHAQSLPPQRIVVAVSHARPLAVPEGPEVVRHPEPAGFAPTANLGLATIPSGPVIVLNDDTEAAPTFVEAMARAARTHGPGIYQPRIVLADSPDGIERIDNTGHRLFLDGFNLGRERGLPAHRSSAPPCGEVGAFSGAAVLFTREVLDATAGFDADFEAYGEDLDLSLRARRRGFRIRFVDDARIRHALGASYGRTGARKVFLIERNRTRAALRSLPTAAVLTLPVWTTLRLAALGTGAAFGRGVGAGVGVRGSLAALAGGLAALTTVPDALRKRAADRPHWTTSDREMWGHLVRHHARPDDLLATGRRA
jgi:GT2 family glycosyltransferase